jgi:hypothetical protein
MIAGSRMSKPFSGSVAMILFAVIRRSRISGDAIFAVGPPAIVHPSTTLLTCSGCRRVSSCAIIPPIDTPNTFALPIPSALSRLLASSAIASTV